MDVLLKLQEIDLQLSDIRAEHDNIPLQMQELDKDVDELKAELEKQESDLKALKLAIREAESKVALLEETAKRYKQQLLAVKTNREYSALLTEIEAVKFEKEELEEKIIREMESSEEVAAQIEETKGRLTEVERVREEKKDELAVKMKVLKDKITVQATKRDNLVQKIKRPVLNLYERIMNSRMRKAVVPLRNGSCGGCFTIVPLQKVADIRKADQIYTCDNCGRILYHEENEGI